MEPPSRFEPDAVEEHRLPGVIPGRGTLLVRFGDGFDGLDIAVVHLALGKRARTQQLKYLARRLDSSRHLIVMGDFNTQVNSPHVEEFREVMDLTVPTKGLATFPSWQPQRAIDHILVSRTMTASKAEVLNVGYSDHCPLAVEIELPDSVRLQEARRPVLTVEAGRPL